MRKLLKLLVTAAVLFPILAVGGCTIGFEFEEGDVDSPEGKGVIADWKIELGTNNTYDKSQLVIKPAPVKAPDGSNAMSVSWGTDNNLTMCELYGVLPAGYNYGKYDGLVLEVWVDVCQQMLFAMRNLPIAGNPASGIQAGTAFRILEDSAGYPYNAAWRIIPAPFEPAGDAGWGIPAEESTLNDWLTNSYKRWKEAPDEAKDIVLTINPKLNEGATGGDVYESPATGLPKGNQINTTYINLYKRIGFYKSVSDDPLNFDKDNDEICWVWNFDEEVEK